MIVVDASVLVVALADDGADGDIARTRLRGVDLVAPEIIDLEVLSVLRGRALGGAVPHRRARLAIEDMMTLPLLRAPHRPLLTRCWELRANVTAYDAAYVAVAEAFGATLLTGDRRLAAATGPRCTIEVLEPAQR